MRLVPAWHPDATRNPPEVLPYRIRVERRDIWSGYKLAEELLASSKTKVVLDIQRYLKKYKTMNSKYIVFTLITALCLVGIYHLFSVGRFSYPEYHLKLGQVAETEIIAPFDFPVLKPETELASERDKAISALPKPYVISEEALFEALSGLDAIYEVVGSFEPPDQLETLAANLKQKGYEFSTEALRFSLRSSLREKVYDGLREGISKVYKRGILSGLEADSLLIMREDNLIKLPRSSFLSVEEARENLASGVPEAKSFAAELATQLIKPNLQVSEDKLNELSQQRISAIPQSEGLVLANEVIVRKNTRVSNEDLRKLESLQEAMRSRNLKRSPLQETLISLGLLLYFLIVIGIANHYYGVLSLQNQRTETDFLPLNLGFFLLALLTTLNSQLLGYSSFLIPFAMFGISAAILVGFEYGVLYSVCSMLLISPFLNWETFTPIVLILGTLGCLIILRRQNAWHEYLMIWLYLVFASVLAVLGLAIYKSDPFIAILRSLGFSVIAASLSIGGIIMIVPYYERKWNLATKQTLLELLDFNHPLLKKLATEAVGTYHHSLIVGNLTERAAEMIGANPLLARVGSYYHDIGKVINTEIFTENNEDSSEIHDNLNPKESAELIRNHVKEGMQLAKKYKIPQPVIDIIRQHHGNSVIRYFYEKANQANEPLNRTDYQYPGPLPQSKEAVLVMLADIVESTTKSKNIAHEDDIAQIIDNAIARLIKEKQLDEAPITLKDLSMVKESFLPVLESIYRKRLDYPEPKKDE